MLVEHRCTKCGEARPTARVRKDGTLITKLCPRCSGKSVDAHSFDSNCHLFLEARMRGENTMELCENCTEEECIEIIEDRRRK